MILKARYPQEHCVQLGREGARARRTGDRQEWQGVEAKIEDRQVKFISQDTLLLVCVCSPLLANHHSSTEFSWPETPERRPPNIRRACFATPNCCRGPRQRRAFSAASRRSQCLFGSCTCSKLPLELWAWREHVLDPQRSAAAVRESGIFFFLLPHSWITPCPLCPVRIPQTTKQTLSSPEVS